MDAIRYFEIKKRMTNGCKSASSCNSCPLSTENNNLNQYCIDFELLYPEKAVEIVEKWAKENPLKTRQSEFLKIIPNADVDEDGVLGVCPRNVDTSFESQCKAKSSCLECRKEYWLAEVEHEDD